jgi:hypothetical protein
MSSFLATVEKAGVFLEWDGRVSLRALKREYELDADDFDELIEELVDIQQVAVREERLSRNRVEHRLGRVRPRQPLLRDDMLSGVSISRANHGSRWLLPSISFGIMLLACACARPSASAPALADEIDSREKVSGSPACTLQPGERTHTIQVDGSRRRYTVNVGPEAIGRGQAPVVFVWHGFGDAGRRFMTNTGFARAWPEAVIIAAEGRDRSFPQFGSHARPGWQVRKGELEDRDLALFDALLAELASSSCPPSPQGPIDCPVDRSIDLGFPVRCRGHRLS